MAHGRVLIQKRLGFFRKNLGSVEPSPIAYPIVGDSFVTFTNPRMKIIDIIIKLSSSTIQDDWGLAYEYASKLSHFEKLDLKYELKANAHIIQPGAKTKLASFYR